VIRFAIIGPLTPVYSLSTVFYKYVCICSRFLLMRVLFKMCSNAKTAQIKDLLPVGFSIIFGYWNNTLSSKFKINHMYT